MTPARVAARALAVARVTVALTLVVTIGALRVTSAFAAGLARPWGPSTMRGGDG